MDGRETSKESGCAKEAMSTRRRRLLAGALGLAVPVLGLLAGPAAANADYEVVSPDQVLGARVITSPGTIPFQSTVQRIAPNPLLAGSDKPRTWDDGCVAWRARVKLPTCAYGDVDSETNVVLMGDSRAMQYFPPIEQVAIERGWRLVNLIRVNCSPASFKGTDRKCDTWRENTLRRIVRSERPEMVILGTATKRSYTVKIGGRTLDRPRSQPYLVEGMKKTIKRLKNAGSRVVVIRDQSLAPYPPLPSECVAENPDRLDLCAFAPRPRGPRAFEQKAASATGTRVIDPQPMFCSSTRCPAVIGDMAVYLDTYHLTATYSATLGDWFADRLPQNP